jgi:hypothetical protein
MMVESLNVALVQSRDCAFIGQGRQFRGCFGGVGWIRDRRVKLNNEEKNLHFVTKRLDHHAFRIVEAKECLPGTCNTLANN